jgi:hypothetical protein
MRRLALVLVVGVILALTACSPTASPPNSPAAHILANSSGLTITASLSGVCHTFNRAAGPTEHSYSQLASLDSHIASLAIETGDPSLRTLGEEFEKQLRGAQGHLQRPSLQTMRTVAPAESPTLRQIGSICMAKGLTPTNIYEEL